MNNQNIEETKEQFNKKIAQENSENIEKTGTELKAPDALLLKMEKFERITSKGVVLLKKVSFSLPEGKLIALLGLSGDGKTTLMDSISGMCTPSHKTYGKVYVKNKSGNLVERDAESWFNRVNYTHQDMIAYKGVSLQNILYSTAACYGKKKQEADDYMALLRLSKVKNVLFENLSGGEQRRSMVIAGLLANKELNIWDEPLTGLDSEVARVIISSMQKTKTTDIVTVHQVSEDLIKRFDHVLLMHMSTIVYSGPRSEMQSYFAEKGIQFPSDMFYINYLMKLCAGNSDDHIDTKNIEIFNDLANEIIHSSPGPVASTNIGLLKTQANVSFPRVLQILHRSLCIDRLFKGSSIIGNVLTFLFIGTIASLGTFIMLHSAYNPKNVPLPYFKYSEQQWGAYLTNMLNLVKNKLASESTVDSKFVEQVTALQIVSANIEWVSALIQIFEYVISLNCISAFLIGPSTFLALDFYRLCRSNIHGKQFTVGDFMCALSIDTFLRKSLIFFVMLMGMLAISVGIMDPIILSSSTIGYAIPISLMFFCSILLGLHSIMLNFAPIPLLLFSIVGGLYAVVINLIPNIILSAVGWVDPSLRACPDTIIPLFARENTEIWLEVIDRFNTLSFIKSLMKVGLQIGVVFTRFMIVCNPIKYFAQMLSKMCLYMNYIRLDSTMKHSIDSTTINRILKEIELLNPSKSNSSDTLKFQDGSFAIEKLKLFCFSSEPNEVFDKASSLKDISALHIIWSETRFWLLPAVLIVLTGLYTYRHLQPKLRN
ncbi:hypothetical protein NEPAR04_2052 [Nematocida parisii]|nr:hypothetical protein NEPAR03_2129 [Nematocida parisii]KAI5130572.1 hypothetical protein NEPAR08_2099 [Nematocida parisii]KAI5144075.1 hypothetical protein NEPAR04_2052 [Nematocida parisii]